MPGLVPGQSDGTEALCGLTRGSERRGLARYVVWRLSRHLSLSELRTVESVK